MKYITKNIYIIIYNVNRWYKHHWLPNINRNMVENVVYIGYMKYY